MNDFAFATTDISPPPLCLFCTTALFQDRVFRTIDSQLFDEEYNEEVQDLIAAVRGHTLALYAGIMTP